VRLSALLRKFLRRPPAEPVVSYGGEFKKTFSVRRLASHVSDSV
jgi:hypothetical protein